MEVVVLYHFLCITFLALQYDSDLTFWQKAKNCHYTGAISKIFKFRGSPDQKSIPLWILIS